MEEQKKKLFTGVITQMQEKQYKPGKDMYFFKIGDLTFSGFGKAPGQNGEVIEFEYKEEQVGDKTYRNVTYISNVVKSIPKPTAGELIGVSAQKKRIAEMMMVAKDIVLLSYRDEKFGENLSIEQKVAIVTNKTKIVWADLCRTIGENPDVKS